MASPVVISSMNNTSRALLGAVTSAVCLLAGTGLASAQTAPSPSPSPSQVPGCGAPQMRSTAATPDRVAPGDPVRVTVTLRDYACYPSEPYRQHVTLYAKAPGSGGGVAVASGETDSGGAVSFTRNPTGSTLYSFDPTFPTGTPYVAAVAVDPTAGTCSGVVRLEGPMHAALGSQVALRGHSSDTSTVLIAIHRRGDSGYYSAGYGSGPQTPDANGDFTALVPVTTDVRYWAEQGRCRSLDGLTTVPTEISGPTVARSGSTVTLTVHGVPTTRVKVLFRKQGTTALVVRRTATTNASGVYRTSYRADADYRYYAITGDERRPSNTALTQVR